MFVMEHIERDENQAGIHLEDIGRALCIWTAMNCGQSTSVSLAAKTFNTTPDVVRAAAAVDPWVFVVDSHEADGNPDKQYLECDGE